MKPFDKHLFASVLSTAKGNRSINQFGIACDVDPGYLSRLLRGLLDNPPSPAILAKIAVQAHNDIGYEDLMCAAGLLAANEETNNALDIQDPNVQRLFKEMTAFFRMQPSMTEEEKEALVQDMREYFTFKASQAQKKK
jgi:transcriptional regulator with XRE-family HTH domain